MKQKSNIFCPQCGHKTKEISSFVRKCIACNFLVFNVTRVTVQIIVENEKGEILFLKRNQQPLKGTWNTPGGFLEPHETLEAAAKRELKEETGISVKKLFYFGSYPDSYFHQNVDGWILAVGFFVRLKNPKLKLNSESSEAIFFDKKKIPFKKIKIPSDIAGLKDYIKLTKQKNSL